MNILNKTKCYLGGNLENTDDCINWREKITKELNSMGVICLDPTKQILTEQVTETEEDRIMLKNWRENCQFDKIHAFMKNVIRRDLRAIDFSYFMIFKLEPTKPTWGTVHEIVVSVQQRKPILILINDKRQMPLWLIGLVNMNYVFEKMEDLISYLKKLDSGEERMDAKYWKILNEELR